MHYIPIGRLRFIQPTQMICTLVFLLVLWMGPCMNVASAQPASYDRTTDAHRFTIFMAHGGWCWYQDPRAIVHGDKLFIGAVRGNGSGPAQVGVYDLAARKPLGTALMRDNFDRDDHNAPAFYARPDGTILAIYARHHRDEFHYSRTANPARPLSWSDEVQHVRTSPNPQDRVTYMNLLLTRSDGVLHNFYRGIDFNPTLITSSDHGITWSQPIHFFANEVGGRHRPYPRYATNGTDTIYVSISDAHPRDFGNSLYYFEFRKGNYYKADGSIIKNLAADGPLKPSECERIYLGSMTTQKPEGFESVPNAAWTSDIAVDAMGHAHIAYSLYQSNTDHRYRLASWNGQKWIDRQIAFAGKCLYWRESSYTGLVSLDPLDPSIVFISTDVHPTTGKDTGGKHEIYRAKISPTDDIQSIQWQPVTSDSPVRNLRPLILRAGDQRIVLWQRGDYQSFTNYDLDTVGFVETIVR